MLAADPFRLHCGSVVLAMLYWSRRCPRRHTTKWDSNDLQLVAVWSDERRVCLFVWYVCPISIYNLILVGQKGVFPTSSLKYFSITGISSTNRVMKDLQMMRLGSTREHTCLLILSLTAHSLSDAAFRVKTHRFCFARAAPKRDDNHEMSWPMIDYKWPTPKKERKAGVIKEKIFLARPRFRAHAYSGSTANPFLQEASKFRGQCYAKVMAYIKQQETSCEFTRRWRCVTMNSQPAMLARLHVSPWSLGSAV